MQNAASVYIDEVQEKAYTMSSCANSEEWRNEPMHCYACVVENQLCTRVNTIQSFQEANRLLPHNLVEFDVQKSSSSSISSRNKVSCPAHNYTF